MKLLATLLFLISLFTQATADEVKYFSGTWAEITARARAENKYIMVDCYTDWCGWCKVMDKETMTNPEVVALLSNKYIAVKMEMEHGEGIKLAMKYHINGFPAFLFLAPGGRLVYQASGYRKPPAFLADLNNALDRNKQIRAPGFSPSIDVDFPEFYKNALGVNGKKELPKLEQVIAYLDTQKDLFTEASWAIIARWDLGDKYSRFFFENISKYRDLYGSACVNDKVNSLLGTVLDDAIKNKNETELMNVLTVLDKYMGADAAEMKLNCRIAYYKSTRDWDKLATAITDLVALKGYEQAGYIGTLCRELATACEDKKILTQASKWMNEVVKKESAYATMDTYALLLYKTGRRKEAGTWVNKAIAEGKKTGIDVSASEELLKKIKAQK